MAYGYSQAMADLIRDKHENDPDDTLFALLIICLDNGIVPSELAQSLGVSKQTVYDWIAERYSPRPDARQAITDLLKAYKKTYRKKG